METEQKQLGLINEILQCLFHFYSGIGVRITKNSISQYQINMLCSDAKIYEYGIDKQNIEILYKQTNQGNSIMTFKKFPNFLKSSLKVAKYNVSLSHSGNFANLTNLGAE